MGVPPMFLEMAIGQDGICSRIRESLIYVFALDGLTIPPVEALKRTIGKQEVLRDYNLVLVIGASVFPPSQREHKWAAQQAADQEHSHESRSNHSACPCCRGSLFLPDVAARQPRKPLLSPPCRRGEFRLEMPKHIHLCQFLRICGGREPISIAKQRFLFESGFR